MIQASRPERRWLEPALIALTFLILGLLGWSLGEGLSRQGDLSRPIADEYWAQFRAGNGLVFNPGERVLLLPWPGYLLLAGLLSPEAIFAISLAGGAACLYWLAGQAGLPRSGQRLCAALFGLALPLWTGVATPYPALAALSLLGLTLAQMNRWPLAALALAAGVSFAPAGAIPALLLLALAVQRGAGWRFGLPLCGALAIGLVALTGYYGSGWWGGPLLLKSPSLTVPFFWLVLAVPLPLLLLAAWGWQQGRANPILVFAGAWLALYVAVVALLSVGTDPQFAPVSGPLVLLAVSGISALVRHRRKIAGYAILVLLGFGPLPFVVLLQLMLVCCAFQPTTLPTAINGQPVQTIGFAELARSPALLKKQMSVRTQPDVLLVAFDGQLQPDLKRMIERGDVRSALVRYAPDVLVTSTVTEISPEKLASEPAWKRFDYHQTPRSSDPRAYQRGVAVGQFVDQPVNADFGPDIRLVGAALDQPALKPGQLVRVRLDWDFARPASRPVTVELRLNGPDREVASAADEYEQRVFRAGAWSTYHTLTVAPDASGGQAQLFVSVIVNNGTVARQVVAKIDIKP